MSVHISVHLLLESRGHLLFIRRGGTTFYPGWFSIVAGHRETGESAEEAMRRETLEEIGLDLSGRLRFAGVTERLFDDYAYFDFYYAALIAERDVVVGEPDKITETLWLPKGAVPAQTVPYVSDTVKQWCDEPSRIFNRTFDYRTMETHAAAGKNGHGRAAP